MITIPKTSDLYNSILNDLQTEYGVTISLFGKVFLRALAAVQAAKLKLFYLSVANLQQNIFPDTAQSESIGGTLERFGRVKLGRNPYPAQAGKYELLVTGSPGATIKSLTTFKSDDTSLHPGFIFILESDYVMPGTTGAITVRALTAGTEAKLNLLDTLTATIPIALIDKKATVQAELVEPLAAENLEDYRNDILASFRLEPQGGAATDYRLWAADAQGVKQVYPYAKSGFTAEIDLFVEANVADSVDGKGTPTAQILSDVEDVVEFDPDITLPINERGRRPLGVFKVNYLPITIKTIDIEIPSFVGLTPTIQANILSAITNAVNLMRPFVDACDVLANKNDILDVNKIIGVIVNAQPGASFAAPVIKVNSVAVTTYTFTAGNIPYLNSVSYT